VWQGQSKANDFRVMDDLEPVAPFDRLTIPDVHLQAAREENSEYPTDLLGPDPTAADQDGLFVPPYLRPDAFPTVSKTEYHFVKAVPIHGTTQVEYRPADTSYSSGDYWQPDVRGGIVAPADRMPADQYPVQAGKDAIHLVPTTARKDRIPDKFARYVDQVEARFQECDEISFNCTTPCVHGDRVVMQLGNTETPVNILSAHIGNMLRVKYQSAAAATSTATPSVPCSFESGCTLFRPCRPRTLPPPGQRSVCSETKVVHEKSPFGDFMQHWQCPAGYDPCSSIEVVIKATYLKKAVSISNTESVLRTCRASVSPIKPSKIELALSR
jgi:hypothetical protein